MDLIQQLRQFTKGDIQQGRWMIGIGIIILIPFFWFLYKSQFALQRGMVIPVCILLMINVIFGSYLLFTKPRDLGQIEMQFHSYPEKTVESLKVKIEKDNRNYRTLKYIWAFGIIISIIFYLVLSKDYLKGLSIGFAVLFLGFLIIDTFFHERLRLFLDYLHKCLK